MSLITFFIIWFIVSIPVTFFIAAVMGKVSNYDAQPANLPKPDYVLPQVKSEPTQQESITAS